MPPRRYKRTCGYRRSRLIRRRPPRLCRRNGTPDRPTGMMFRRYWSARREEGPRGETRRLSRCVSSVSQPRQIRTGRRFQQRPITRARAAYAYTRPTRRLRCERRGRSTRGIRRWRRRCRKLRFKSDLGGWRTRCWSRGWMRARTCRCRCRGAWIMWKLAGWKRPRPCQTLAMRWVGCLYGSVGGGRDRGLRGNDVCENYIPSKWQLVNDPICCFARSFHGSNDLRPLNERAYEIDDLQNGQSRTIQILMEVLFF